MNTTATRTGTATIAEGAAAIPRHDKTISATRNAARTRRRTPLLLIIAAEIAAVLPLMGATLAQAATYQDPTPAWARCRPRRPRAAERHRTRSTSAATAR